jgi:hypothetical protein
MTHNPEHINAILLTQPKKFFTDCQLSLFADVHIELDIKRQGCANDPCLPCANQPKSSTGNISWSGPDLFRKQATCLFPRCM